MRRSVQHFLNSLQKRPLLGWLVAGLWVMFLSWMIAWFHLGGIGLVDETEPLFAEASRQMTVTGDWITPYFNGETRFDKPPLVYWLMAIAYQTVGVNEWSARFPSALAITGLTALGFYTLYRFGVPKPATMQTPLSNSESESTVAASTVPASVRWSSALIGSAAIALNPQTFLWSRTGVSDMLLSGCMGAALLAFFCGYAQPHDPQRQRRWYLAFYILSALAVLTKGPVGIVLPGFIIVAFLLYLGNLRSVLQEMRLRQGSLLFVLITLPWYIAVIWINGENYTNSFFGYHNFERFTRVVNNHSAPWFFYFIVVLLGFLPWSVHLPVAIARLRFWQRQRWQQQPRSSHLGLFALSWFVVIFAFFTIAVTKLPSYTLPLLPATGILVGLFWSDQMHRPRSNRGVWISHGMNILLFIGLAIAAWYSPHWLGNDPEMPDLAAQVQRSGLTVWVAAVWVAVAIGGVILLVRRQGRWLWSANLIGFVSFVLVGLVPVAMIVDGQRQLPLRQLAETIVQVQQPQEPILMIGFSKPSLVFYTQQPVIYLSDVDETVKELRQLARQNKDSESLLLIGRTLKFEEAELSPEVYQTIDQAGVYQLVRIQMADVRAGLKSVR